MAKRYKNVDELPRLVHRILGPTKNYEILGFFQYIVNKELAKGKTEAEAWTEAWRWIKKIWNKPE